VWLGAGAAVALGAYMLLKGPAAPQHAAGDTPGRAEILTARTVVSTPEAPPVGAAEPRGGDDDPGADDAPAGAVPLVNPVDLAALRKELPDNVYWELGAPTEDPGVLARRREEEQRMNDLLGKVQSGTATEEEINQYYERRRQISEDYIEFATRVLEKHRGQLSDEDTGLYALGVKMHRARLEEIPRKVNDALERKKLQERRREEQRTSR
jgi:hypothetical protein